MRNPILVKLGLESSTVATATPQATLPAAAPETATVATTTVTPTPDTLPLETVATATAEPLAVAVPSDVEPEVAFVAATATAPAANGLGLEPPAVGVESETVPVATTLQAPDGQGATVTPEATPVPPIPEGELPSDVLPPVVVDTLSIDVPAVAVDSEIEYSEAAHDMENATVGVETLFNAALALEEIAGLQPELINQESEKQVVYLAIASATAPLQSPEFTESVSIENLNEKLKHLWEAIKAAIKKLFAKIAAFFKYSKGNAKRTQALLSNATSDLKKAKVRTFTVHVKSGPAHSVTRAGNVITIESSHPLETLSHANARHTADIIHTLTVKYAAGFTQLLTVLAKVESHVKHFSKDQDVTAIVAELATELKDNTITKDGDTVTDGKLVTETLSESQLLAVFSTVTICIDNASKLLDLIDKQQNAIETVVERIVIAASKISDTPTALGSLIRNVVLRETNRVVVQTTSEYNKVNKALNVQSATASAVVSHIGTLAEE